MSDHSAASSIGLYCVEDAEDVVQTHLNTWIPFSPPSFSSLSPQSDESSINHFFEFEAKRHHVPHPDFPRIGLHLTSRQDSINWILKVHAHYRFKPATAFLSVNYFDRFLSSHSLPGSGWPYQLLSVACLSLAAKMEEPYVPLLIDLQIFEPRYVFEPKTIQRMELWVMANLNWRLRSVTPYDFLHYFISKLKSSGSFPSKTIIPASSELILNTTRVIDFLEYSPSVIAASAVLCAAAERGDLPDTFFERVNKETVRSCHQLMQEYLVDTCPSADPKISYSLEPPTTPQSPIGVLDAAACASCDTRSENPCTVSGTVGGGEAKPDGPELNRPTSNVAELPGSQL